VSLRDRFRRAPRSGASRLRRLDDRLVPRLAARTQGGAARAASTRTTAREAAAGRVPPPAPTSGARRTERLDARLTRRGPLAVLRVLPGLGLLLAALVLGAGAVAAVATGGGNDTAVPGTAPPPRAAASPTPDQTTAAEPDEEPVGQTSALGPEPGELVDEHLADATAALAALVESDPDTPRLALLHLEDYTDPPRTAALVAGVEPLRALVRVPLPGVQTAVTPVSVRDLPLDLVLAMSELAPRRLAVAEADQAAAPVGPAGQAQRDSAAAARLEASQLEGGCACVVAVVVRASPSRLAAIEGRPGLRGIVPGPTGVAPESLVLRPLLPEQTGTVTPPGSP
jgi:hypothetical protein